MEETRIFCMYCDPPVPAVRSCLQCETSMCDEHLTAHNKTLDHILVACHSLQGRCSVHKEPLCYYCTEDAACACVCCCWFGEHSGHRVLTLEEASAEKKRTISNVLQEITADRHRYPAEKLLQHIAIVHETAVREEAEVQDLFRDIRRQLEELEKSVHEETSRRKEQLTLVLSHRKHQQESEAELSVRAQRMEELCKVTDPVTFLQEVDKHGQDLPDIQKILKARRAEYGRLCDLLPPDTGFIPHNLRKRLFSILTDLQEIPKNVLHKQIEVKQNPTSTISDLSSMKTVISANTKVHRLRLTSAGRHKCSETGIQFEVRGPVILNYHFESWENHMSDTQRNGYEIVGPLFHVMTQEGQDNVAAVFLPHYLAPECCNQYKSYIKCVHYNENKIILETPTRLDPSYVVLENPTFSYLGALLEKFWTFIARPFAFNGIVLIYCKMETTCCIRLYVMIDNEPRLKKAIDEEIEKEFRYIGKPPQTKAVHLIKEYRVHGPRGAVIVPELVHFRMTCPSKLYPYAEITLEEINEDIQLCLTQKSSGGTIWSCSLRKDALDKLKKNTTRSARGGGSEKSPVSEAKRFMQKNYKSLCERIVVLSPILLSLREKGVINEAEEDEITCPRTPLEKNRSMLSMIVKKGAEEKFYEALKENNSPLVEHLEDALSRMQIK
ncbi:caspase recruitment domain-containing protein 8-like [Anomaloglossus baeobatrachus]